MQTKKLSWKMATEEEWHPSHYHTGKIDRLDGKIQSLILGTGD